MTSLPARLRQPDPRSCGAACVVVAADLAAGGVAPGRETGFAGDVVAAHRRLTRLRLHDRLQVPWPRALGTPPWAVARELTAITGTPHRTRVLRWSDPVRQDSGALYVGSRWLPRHVVLVVGADGDVLRCYEPAAGRLVDVDLARLARHRAAVAGWRWVWLSVTPTR